MKPRVPSLIAIMGLVCSMTLIGGSAEADFESYLSGVQREALRKGISQQTLDAALAGIEFLPKVVERDRRQVHKRLSFQEYMDIVVPESRVEDGRVFVAENRDLLDRVAARYGVPWEIIGALWGVESDFGRRMGSYPVIGALATLAYDGRRGKFFRAELMAALQILDEGHVAPDAMLGSWAGAMGQSQFMPTSFVRLAVDENGDGRRDIWGTLDDVFGSAANYLKKVGWRTGEPWGRQVLLPPNFNYGRKGQKRSVAGWSKLGLTTMSGDMLPEQQLTATLYLPGGASGPAYLGYPNMRAIMRWNNSVFFALAVGTLADRLADRT